MSEPTRRARLPRHRLVDADERPPMVLTARDTALIRAVNDYRIVRSDHLRVLFGMSKSSLQYRLVRLYQHEYLNRLFLTAVTAGPASSTPLYVLKKRGAQVLVDTFGYDQRDLRLPKVRTFKWDFVEHTLKLSDVRLAIAVAARTQGWQLETWWDELVFRATPDTVYLTNSHGRRVKKPVLPDGYFCLAGLPFGREGRARFLVEIDRGIEPKSAFRPQIEVYEQYTESGGYEARFQAKSLRILIVTTTVRRLATLQAVVARAGGDRKYWFTTFDQLTPETALTEPIWQVLTEDGPLPLIDGR